MKYLFLIVSYPVLWVIVATKTFSVLYSLNQLFVRGFRRLLSRIEVCLLAVEVALVDG